MAKIEAPHVNEEWIESRDELLSHLRGLVNKAEWSDVVLKCSDGVGVHACRGLLAIRCKVFESMLSSGVSETRDSELSFPNISSPVMLCVMEFLHTGFIESHSLVDWKMGFETVSAAKYFAIRILENIARDFLHRQLLQVNSNSQKAVLMEMLSVALGFPEMWDEKDDLLVSLVDHIGHDWFEERSSHKLSTRALDYILSSRKRDCGGEELSMEEYFTFRKIVLWLVNQGVPESDAGARAAVRVALPGKYSPSLLNRMLTIPPDISLYMADASKSMTSCDTTAVLNSISGTKICKKSLELLLRHINLALIPPALLLNLVYPLEIIPPRQLLDAFIRQALRRRVQTQFSLPAIHWKHDAGVEIGDEGQIFSTAPRGSATALIRTSESSQTYEWSFEILNDGADCIQLGFVFEPLGDAIEEDELLMRNLWERSSPRILWVNRLVKRTYVSKNNPQRFCNAWKCFKAKVKVNSVVNFKLNRSAKSCRVVFSDSCDAVWDELPDRQFFPAVQFLSNRSARVQLRLGDGFQSFI